MTGSIYTQKLKQFRMESFGNIFADHPTFKECLEFDKVCELEVNTYSFFKFRKGGEIKSLRVVRIG